MDASSNQRGIAAVFRILAVWIAVETLVAVPGFIASWLEMRGENPVFEGATVWPALVRLVASFVGAAVLWSLSDWLASRVWPSKEAASSAGSWNARNMQVAAFRAIGTYLLIVGVPDLLELAAGYYTLPAGFGMETTYSGRLWARALGVGFQIVFGVILLFASHRVVRVGADDV
jgi:hypothetical protein